MKVGEVEAFESWRSHRSGSRVGMGEGSGCQALGPQAATDVPPPINSNMPAQC